ncbi:MAG: crossover junction endodeoxyribonuclease RuvC [Desulfobacterales bacterium]|nr:crossover junction endodeoxyribonuclease RuvC [Desulfobacterales bacterium]
MKVVGIDPGLAGTGVAIIEGDLREIQGYSFGSISTQASEPTPLRLHTIYSKIYDFLAEQKPDLVVIEDIYSLEKYPGSGIMLGKVSGVILLAAHQVGGKFEEVAVREMKKIICGSGNADKSQVEKSVRNQLGHPEPIRPYHASDALGLALAGYYRHRRGI